MLLWSWWGCVEEARVLTEATPLAVVVMEPPNLLAIELSAVGEERLEAVCVAEDDASDVLIGSVDPDRAGVVGIAGLRPDSPYDCVVRAGARSALVTVERDLGDREPPAVTLEGDPELGTWTTFLQRDEPGTLWVLDPWGRPRLAVPVSSNVDEAPRADWFAEIVEDTVLVGGTALAPQRLDRYGRVVARPDPVWENHHDAQREADATLFLTRVPSEDGEGFAIEELGDDGGPGWMFLSADAVAAGELPSRTGEDPFHANAVRPAPDGTSVWVSLRNLGRIVRIERGSGRVLGSIGPGEAWDLPPEAALLNQHDPRLLAGGRMLVLDNGNSVRGWSRILEFAVPDEPGPVEVLRSFTEPGWYEPVMGGVDELPDGRWAITRAHCGGEHCDRNDPTARAQLLVVEPDSGAVDWRLVFAEGEGTYRARPVDPCDLLGACALDRVGDTGLTEL